MASIGRDCGDCLVRKRRRFGSITAAPHHSIRAAFAVPPPAPLG
jgi:hypothetical protein